MDWLGWIAAVSSGLRALPQVYRLLTTGTTRGISAPAMLFTTITAIGWCVWAVERGELPVALSSSLTAVGFGLVAARLVMVEPQPVGLALQGSWACALLSVGLLSGAQDLGWLVSLGSALQFLPQARKSMQETDLSGVSIWTYLLAMSNEMLWLSYGIAITSPVLMLPYLVRAPTSGYIIIRTLGSRRLTPEDVEPPPPPAV